MFNFVRLSEGGTAAVEGEMRSEVSILSALAERLLLPGRFDWSSLRSHRELRRRIAEAVPGYGAIARIESPGGEFHVDGRVFRAPSFPTSDGRARFHVVPHPAFTLPDGAFRLTTIRSEGQFNTVVYEEEDPYRGNARRDVVMISEEDARRLRLAEGDRVSVETETGAMEVAVSYAPIRPGSIAMYYPEANLLVPRRIDGRSGTPAFKSVAARLRKLTEG
jgi:anaerobic selenocysteine-containing dehydrogenase